MNRQGCTCSEKNPEMTCRLCGSDLPLAYWCETCQQLVPDKRCPHCGLKTRKVRQPG
jgi:predicted RNA-binding protein with PUA domain